MGFEPTQHYVMRNPLSAGKPKLESHALTARPSCHALSGGIDSNKCISYYYEITSLVLSKLPFSKPDADWRSKRTLKILCPSVKHTRWRSCVRRPNARSNQELQSLTETFASKRFRSYLFGTHHAPFRRALLTCEKGAQQTRILLRTRASLAEHRVCFYWIRFTRRCQGLGGAGKGCHQVGCRSWSQRNTGKHLTWYC